MACHLLNAKQLPKQMLANQQWTISHINSLQKYDVFNQENTLEILICKVAMVLVVCSAIFLELHLFVLTHFF